MYHIPLCTALLTLHWSSLKITKSNSVSGHKKSFYHNNYGPRDGSTSAVGWENWLPITMDDEVHNGDGFIGCGRFSSTGNQQPNTTTTTTTTSYNNMDDWHALWLAMEDKNVSLNQDWMDVLLTGLPLLLLPNLDINEKSKKSLKLDYVKNICKLIVGLLFQKLICQINLMNQIQNWKSLQELHICTMYIWICIYIYIYISVYRQRFWMSM